MLPANAAHNAPEKAGATQPEETAPIFLARSFWSPFMRMVRTAVFTYTYLLHLKIESLLWLSSFYPRPIL